MMKQTIFLKIQTESSRFSANQVFEVYGFYFFSLNRNAASSIFKMNQALSKKN